MLQTVPLYTQVTVHVLPEPYITLCHRVTSFPQPIDGLILYLEGRHYCDKKPKHISMTGGRKWFNYYWLAKRKGRTLNRVMPTSLHQCRVNSVSSDTQLRTVLFFFFKILNEPKSKASGGTVFSLFLCFTLLNHVYSFLKIQKGFFKHTTDCSGLCFGYHISSHNHQSCNIIH